LSISGPNSDDAPVKWLS